MPIIGRHFETGLPITIETEDGKIGQVSELPGERDLPWIAPGFVDLQKRIGICPDYLSAAGR